MPTASEFLSTPPFFFLLVNGMPDSGKSDLAMTFPDCYVLTFDPAGFDILKGKSERAQQLAKNLRHIEVLQPAGTTEVKALFDRTREKQPITGEHRDSVYGCLKHIEEMARAGQIRTIVFDGLNYFVDVKWSLVCEDGKNLSSNTGELDRFAAYRDIKNYLTRFMWSELLPLATRLKLNLIVTCHIKRESQEMIEGTVDKKTGMKAAGKVAHDSDLAPVIEGSFRNTIDGKFGGVIYLEHKQGLREVMINGKVEKRPGLTYWAYCKKTSALQTIVLAKNKYNLPARLEITDKSFYEELMARVMQPGLPVEVLIEEKIVAPMSAPTLKPQLQLGRKVEVAK